MWKIRLSGYLAGFLAFAAFLVASLFGWGTYDAATGMFDPPPIDLKAVAGLVVTGLGNLLAALAVIRKWGR